MFIYRYPQEVKCKEGFKGTTAPTPSVFWDATIFLLQKICSCFMVSRFWCKFHLNILSDFNFRCFEFHRDSEICDQTWIPLFSCSKTALLVTLSPTDCQPIINQQVSAKFYINQFRLLRKENFLVWSLELVIKVTLCVCTKCLLASRVVLSANLIRRIIS